MPLPDPFAHLDSLAALVDCPRAVTEAFKFWFAGAGALLALAWRWLPRRAALAALGLLVVLGTANYLRWGPRLLVERVDAYDLVHYYVNAKYFDELGYFDLYPAAILADHEAGGPHFREGTRYMAQNEAGHAFMPISHALRRGRQVREERFTPERWAAFEHDLLYLQRETGAFTDRLWRQMIQDHGFNGTPAWTVLARPLAERVPVERVKLLGYLDLALLAVGVAAIGWAYGSAAALWTWFFLVVTYSTRWPTVTWSFLRYDWVASLMVGLALLRRGGVLGAALSGLVTAHAAAMRLFPALWTFGPAARALLGRLDRRLLAFGLAFAVGVAGLEGLAAARLGPDALRVHFENMLDHNRPEQLSSRRVGLALALPFRGELLPKYIEPARKEAVARQKPVRFAIAGVVLAVLGWGLARAGRDDEAYAMGFLPFFLLTTASYYYYVARVTLVAVHAGDLRRARNAVGLALLLGIEAFSNWAESVYPGHRVFLVGGLAWGLSGYAALMAAWFAVDGLRARRGRARA